MFTGLVEEVGILNHLTPIGNDQAEISIACKKIQGDLALGDSVAVEGVCLTITRFSENEVVMELSTETVRKTIFGNKKLGDLLNLERALQVGGRLGGHIVQGHVDSLGSLANVHKQGKFYEISFNYPKEIRKYLVNKGSITINGISLTIASLEETSFTVAIIPHTFQGTSLKGLKAGDPIHLETDVLAKYVENLLLYGSKEDDQKPESKITAQFLQDKGW
ncbi:MAG: riboflavin synthase [bacterium]|jgi:riboflavin synthase